ncbi:Retroviral aspartyl protease [Sesbania bispinosa]|nr:Retroviral aspartyl protease [Sesbania bispinosa]
MRVKRFVRGLREYIFRSVVGSNCSTFAESSHPSVGVGSVPGYQVQQRTVAQRGGSSGQSFGTAQSRHIRRDCPVAETQPSSSHASAPAALASSQAPSAPVRLLGGSSGRDSGVAQQSGRGSGGRGQAHAGRGQARVFAMTRQDAQASNAVVTDFDVILDMDWLASHYATLDCHNKVVKFKMLGESVFSFQGEQGWAPYNLISSLRASRLWRKGFAGVFGFGEGYTDI